MDSREIPPPPSLQQQPPPGLIMSHFRNPNSGGSLMGPTSTSSQSIHHHRSVFGALGPPLDHQKNMDSLGFNDGSSPSSQPARFGIDQSQNQQQQVKKKRGRPRKYTPEGNIALGLAPASPLLSAASNSYGGGGGEGESGGGNANSADPPAKRNRGRPPGSSKKLVEPLGTAGSGFTPHVIEVKQGEDIASKVMAFSDHGPRTICILSATGSVSSVALRQPTNPNGSISYEGRFEIITFSGSFMNYEVNGEANRSGSLTVALTGTDGRILGGSVLGPLVAASPVQVIVGSFVADPKKQKQSSGGNNARGPNPPEPASAPANMLNFGSNSQGPSSESSENESGSSPSMHRDNNNNNNGIYANSVAQQQQQLRQMQHVYHPHWPSHGHGHGQ